MLLSNAFKSTFGNTPVLLRIIVLNLGIMSGTMMISWSSPCLPKLDGTKDPQNNPLQKPITTLEKSQLASAPLLSGLLTCFLPLLLMCCLRRKCTYILLSLPNIAGLLLLRFSFNFWMIYAGRLLCGITLGILQIVPRYSAEISLPQTRGAMGCFLTFFMTLGHLVSFSVGPFVSFATFHQISLIPASLLVFLLVFYIEDSPFDLIVKDPEKARQILLRLRRKTLEEELDAEIEAMRLISQSAKQFNLREFCTSKAARRSMVICSILFIFAHLTGLTVVAAYMQRIFTDSKVPYPEYAAILVGAVQFLSTFIPPFLIDRMGRKFLLALGQCGLLLCLCTFAVYNTIIEVTTFDMSSFRWVPVVSLFFFSCCFYSGIGLVPFILMGEMFPANLKNVSSFAAIFWQILCIYLMTLAYPLLVDAINLANTFWLYAGFSLLGLVFIIVFVPETKQKTFEEIQRMMEQ